MENILPVRNNPLPIKKLKYDVAISINDTLHVESFGQIVFTKVHNYWRHLKNIAIVYILIYQKEFIYIGHTNDFHQRISSHALGKNIDEIITIECDSIISARRIERRLIKRYQPKINCKSK
jgi:hypothetical protein